MKLKELSYRWAEAYPAGELKHGPLALVDEGTPVVVIDHGRTEDPVGDRRGPGPRWFRHHHRRRVGGHPRARPPWHRWPGLGRDDGAVGSARGRRAAADARP
ncbi:SIS domain-containing protein [Curtobacterium flaccumfaciens]|nr:SIS domain-containing protein [Curtobacterium flaccumfaciens]